MTRSIPIGEQEFECLRSNNGFYVDKTAFIGEWWRARSRVTVITRPRRFGKTLMLDTVACFFSNARRDQASLFGDLAVWRDEAMRSLAGTRPVIALTFSGVAGKSAQEMRGLIAWLINDVFSQFRWLQDSPALDAAERKAIAEFSPKADVASVQAGLRTLSQALHKHFGVKPIILLDEFDTPLLAAVRAGCEAEMASFLRVLLNLTFKANPSLERGLLMGVVPVSADGILTDIGAEVVTTITDKYQTAFGFTEAEVFAAMEEFGLTDKVGVRQWYDGYCFGSVKGVYNPWAITSYLNRRELGPYWMQTGSLVPVVRLIEGGSRETKQKWADLISGKSIEVSVKETDVCCDQRNAIWSLLLAGGYLRVVSKRSNGGFELGLANGEVRRSIRDGVSLP